MKNTFFISCTVYSAHRASTKLRKLKSQNNVKDFPIWYYSQERERDHWSVSNFGINPSAVCGYRVPSSPHREKSIRQATAERRRYASVIPWFRTAETEREREGGYSSRLRWLRELFSRSFVYAMAFSFLLVDVVAGETRFWGETRALPGFTVPLFSINCDDFRFFFCTVEIVINFSFNW